MRKDGPPLYIKPVLKLLYLMLNEALGVKPYEFRVSSSIIAGIGCMGRNGRSTKNPIADRFDQSQWKATNQFDQTISACE